MADVNVETANDNSESVDEFVDPTSEVGNLLEAINGFVPDKDEPKIAATPEKAPEKVEPAKEPVKEEEKKPSEADRGLERLAAKEKEIREARETFDKERAQYIKFSELSTNPSAVLAKVGLDPDVLMKTILYEKLPDGNPVKAKLKAELAETLTQKQINALRDEMSARDRRQQIEAENARNYQETVTKIESYVGKFKDEDNKTLPTLSTIGKGDAGVLKELILDEMINDAALRYARGEDGDPINHEEAANRIEKRLAKLVPLINKIANEINKGSDEKASGTGVKKRPVVRPGPAQAKGQPQKTSQQELDDLISNVLSGKV